MKSPRLRPASEQSTDQTLRGLPPSCFPKLLYQADRRRLDGRHSLRRWGVSPIEPATRQEKAKREQKLSLVNARDRFICKISYAIASPPPAVAALPGRFLPDLARRRKPRGPFFYGKQL